MTPEKVVQNSIRLYCGQHNILCFRCNVGKVQLATGGYFDTGLPEGFSDLIILPGNGIIIFCEVKAPKGHQRQDQIKFQQSVESRGYKYILAHSLEEFILELKKTR